MHAQSNADRLQQPSIQNRVTVTPIPDFSSSAQVGPGKSGTGMALPVGRPT